MSYSCKILADSISDIGIRLTSLELVYPRIIHSEILTHRMLSRNGASSRAIPVEKIIQRVKDNPYIPTYWGKNKSGMQAIEEVEGFNRISAINCWNQAKSNAIIYAGILAQYGVHKQLVNRLLEPFSWYTSIVTATDWTNFLNLRDHKSAQPEFQSLTSLIRSTLTNNEPEYIKPGYWHLPLLPDKEELVSEGWSLGDIIKVSAGRCARVSYLTHNGTRDVVKDIALADRMMYEGHFSPYEHCAKAMKKSGYIGNFNGWAQFRKFIPGESVFTG